MIKRKILKIALNLCFSPAIGRISYGLKNEFELATVNASSVFYCIYFLLFVTKLFLIWYHWKALLPDCGISWVSSFIFCITKTCLYNFDPLKPHFYTVKLGFTGVYIIFLTSAQKHTLWVLVRSASPNVNLCFEQTYEKIRVFYLIFFFSFWR